MFSAWSLLAKSVFWPKNGPVPDGSLHSPRTRPRRGVAVLLVLLLLSVTLALSYAGMRSQGTSVQIQQNSQRRSSARQVAITGLAMALKKMQTPSWAGPGTTLSGSLSSYESFTVRYSVGDPTLAPGSADYADYPYRVTLLSTGSAADPNNPQCTATHQIRMVVRLTPRKLSDEPSDWAAMQRYTLYQTTTDGVELDIPSRVEGPVRIQGKLKVAPDYPNDNDAWPRYLGDLNAMRLAGLSDYRPVNGPVYLRVPNQEAKCLWALILLGVTAVDTPVNTASGDWVNVSSPTTYQIYEGGPVYNIPALGNTLQGVSLGPDPITNPLGIYYCDSNLDIQGDVTIQGTLLCTRNIQITGTNVQFQPVNMPALYDSPQVPVRLPVLTCQNLTIKPTAGGSLTGLLAVFDQFLIEKSPAIVTFPMTGRVISRKFYINQRQPWDGLNWGNYYTNFMFQRILPFGVPYFPVYMGNQGYNPQPKLTFKPDPTAVAYHWYNQYYPLYVPHPSDADLRWEMVSWTENP
jgi:hypothetical protein